MSFLHPELIYYLLPPMLILFGFLLTQKESQMRFFSDEVMDKLRVSSNMLTLKARNALFLLIGILLVIALAQPVIKDGTVQIKAKSADIMIALDISDSMLAEDVYPSRLEFAKKKALSLLKESQNERLGVVAFAKNSYLVSPLSFDSSAVAFLLSKLDTSSITQKGTDYLSMLEVVASSQSKSEKKYLLVISDGGDEEDFYKEIKYAKDKGIVVFVLGMGTDKGAPIKKKDGTFIKYKGDIIVSKLNEKISSFATQTGGVYIENTTSDKDIKTMFNEMQSISDKKELKSQDIQKYIPLFYYPLGLALFLLLIATSSMSKRVTVDVPNLFLVAVIAFSITDTKAGMLDFMELDKAKKAYEAGEYENSAKIYEQYAQQHQNSQSYFNAANSYYKQRNYKKALEYYEKATFDDKFQRADNYANMGNAYAKSNSLEKAKSAYERSLEIKEDKDVRENLEAVKKELEKQKQEKQKNNQDKKDKDSKDKDKDKQDKDNKDSKDDKSEDSDNKNSDDKSKNKEDKDDSKSDKSDDKKQDNKDSKSKDEDDQKLEKLSKENNESKKDASKDKQLADSQIKQMSDAELQKWIDQLQTKQRTYLYQLNKSNKRQDENEKPW